MSTSDAETGRLSWRDLDDLVRVLASDRSSRLCAHMNGWAAPVDGLWLTSALLEATAGSRVLWPWIKPDEPTVDPADVARVQESIAKRWGAGNG